METAKLESQLRGLGEASYPEVRLPTDHPHKGCIYGTKVKHLFAYMQVGGSSISVLSCRYIFKEPGLGVFASPPRFHSGGPAQVGARGDESQNL